MSDAVQVIFNGVAFEAWTSAEITRDLFSPAASWTVEVARPSANQVAALREASSVLLRLRDATLLSGFVDSVELVTGRDGHLLSVTGRDFAGPLADCAVPPGWRWSGGPAASFVAKVCAEVGVVPAIQADAVTVPALTPKTGERLWGVLARAAAAQERRVWTQSAGLVFGKPASTSTSPTRATLRVGAQANVLRLSHSWRRSGRRSPLWVQGGGGGDWGGGVLAKAEDAELVALGVRRPDVVTDDGDSGSASAKVRAAMEVARRASEAWSAQVDIPGLGPTASTLWEVNDLVAVEDAVASFAGPAWVTGVRMRRFRAGTTTTLTLKAVGSTFPKES